MKNLDGIPSSPFAGPRSLLHSPKIFTVDPKQDNFATIKQEND